MVNKPRLGQNFLISPTAPLAMVRALEDTQGFLVVEIGPGRGALTVPLAAVSEQLVAIEYDPRLAAELRARFAAQAQVTILDADILAVDLTALAAQAGRKLLVAGNLPYYITSEILLHLFAHREVIARAVLMVQREVADRVTAAPGSRDYGLLSATTQLYAEAESLFTLPPGDFSPPPEVFSTVVRLRMRPRFPEGTLHTESFLRFLRGCFAQKRKTLANNLRAAGCAPEAIIAALAACCIAPAARAETIALEGMACLFRELHTAGASAGDPLPSPAEGPPDF